MDKDLVAKADSYLDHMLIASRVGDRSSGMWRNMLDNWNCYSRGHPFIASGGRGQPHWFNKARPRKHGEAMLKMHRRSIEASRLIHENADQPLAIDHAVPVNVLRDMMIEMAPAFSDREDVRQFLHTWYRLCVVTLDEHALLNRGEFHRARVEPHAIFDRYSRAGIDLVDE